MGVLFYTASAGDVLGKPLLHGRLLLNEVICTRDREDRFATGNIIIVGVGGVMELYTQSFGQAMTNSCSCGRHDRSPWQWTSTSTFPSRLGGVLVSWAVARTVKSLVDAGVL